MATTAESGRKQEWLVPRRPPVEAYELLSPVQQRRVDRYPEPERAAAAWLLLIDSGPEWRARATPCRNCAGQRWPCVDPVTPGQRRRCEGCYRSGWVCNDPTPLWAVPAAPATPRASASTPNAPVGRATAPATPVFRPSTATTILDLTSTSSLGRRQRRASSRDAEDAEVTVAADREAELFFASCSVEEDSNSDSDDDIEFIGKSETPASAQPPKKRPRNASPRPALLATDAAGPSTARPSPRTTLVVNSSTEFTIYVARDILKAAEQTAPSDVAVSWPGRPPPSRQIAHTVMVHSYRKSFNIAVWDHRARTVNYIHQTGFEFDENVVNEVLTLGRVRNLYKAEDGVAWVACPARQRPPAVSPGMWASVIAVWLTRNHGVQECLELLDQFQIRPAHVCDDLNAILRGEHWSGQCFELQGRPRNTRTAAEAPQQSQPASASAAAQTPAAPSGSAQTTASTPPPPAVLAPRPLPSPSLKTNIDGNTDFNPELVRRLLAGAQKTAHKSVSLAFNDEMMGSSTTVIIMVFNIKSSWCIAIWRGNPRDVHYIHVPGASDTNEDRGNFARHLGKKYKHSKWIPMPCPLLKGLPGGVWVSVMAAWLSRGPKLNKRFRDLPRFTIRQEMIRCNIDSLLRNGGWSGNCILLVDSPAVKQEADNTSLSETRQASPHSASRGTGDTAGAAGGLGPQPKHQSVKAEPSTPAPSVQNTLLSTLRSPSSIFEYTPPPVRR